MQDSYWSYENCIFIGGTHAVFRGERNSVKNCNFYGQTTVAIYVSNAAQVMSGISNNIFMLAVGANVLGISSTGGSVGPFAHNMYCDVNGDDLETPFDNNGTAFTPFGGGNVAADPLFRCLIDGQYDFRLHRNSPAINMGHPGFNGGRPTIGAWPPKTVLVSPSLRTRYENLSIYN